MSYILQALNVRPPTGQASTSMGRAPAPINDFIRGKSGYLPFWPGGLDDLSEIVEEEVGISSGEKGLRTTPPGFSRGLQLPEDETADDAVLNFEEFPGFVPRQSELVITFYVCLSAYFF
jgi:antiviral helicase SKI2